MKKVAVALHATDEFDINSVVHLKTLDYIHVDVMDGIFVNNTMLNLEVFKQLSNAFTIPIIAHLMVTNPQQYIEKIYEYTTAIFFHYEVEMDKSSIIRAIRKFDRKIGMVLNPPTPISEIIPFLKELDFVLVMGVHPGWSGQTFIPNTISKVKELATYKDQYSFEIDVDGGVNLENARKLIYADILSSSSTILKATNPNEVINSLRNT
ncbi:MAG: putative Ribulose-phosphate 3-epimerase [Promethearchaeota archaeon]|nr:MAG: putative Ribulose-phosphate 3-epimerase [Candidatus Lokiarchaeota archaeon]